MNLLKERQIIVMLVMLVFMFAIFSPICAAFANESESYKCLNKNLPDVPLVETENLLEVRLSGPYSEYIIDICKSYPTVSPFLVQSVMYHESSCNPYCVNSNGTCVGLMQIYIKYHMDRATRLHVTDFYDPYNSLLLGVDYLSELYDNLGDWKLVLMTYNMGYKKAYSLYSSGKVSTYASSILSMAERLEKGEVIFE